jgi:GWxTD domain-containing protein
MKLFANVPFDLPGRALHLADKCAARVLFSKHIRNAKSVLSGLPKVNFRMRITAVSSVFLALSAISIPLFGQRVFSYADLAMRQRESAVFFTFNPVPSLRQDSVTFAISFRISYDYLAFTKPAGDSGIEIPEGAQYYSQVEVVLEMGEADTTRKTAAPENRPMEVMQGRPARQSQQAPPNAVPDRSGMIASRYRAIWKGTAFAGSYAETSSGDRYFEGVFFITIPFGSFDYLFVLRESGRSEERTTGTRRLGVKPRDVSRYMAPVLLDQRNPKSAEMPLLNLTNNSFYGKNFTLAVVVPAGSTTVGNVLIREARTPAAQGPRQPKRTSALPADTVPPAPVLQLPVSGATRVSGYTLRYPDITKAQVVQTANASFDILYFDVPATTLKNNYYTLSVEGENGTPLWSWRFLTLWRDMPRSLYNLDVSIDMLKFMLTKEQIKDMKKGGTAEREKNFRSFWAQKDPTKGTEFNELMNEYYRRIDFAFDNYSSPQRPGFDSDQGQTYIRMGPPLRTRRDFSSGNAALEIWEYPGKQEVIFRATSGFGDFERIK